jgi:hypothetical protein
VPTDLRLRRRGSAIGNERRHSRETNIGNRGKAKRFRK